MAEHVLTAAPVRRASALPLSLRVALVYLVARALTTGFLLLASSLSGPASRFGDAPTLGDFVVAWDGQWYWLTAERGYPSELPMADTVDRVAESQWAFMPIYPYLARALGFLLGSWSAGALVISLVAGYLACLVLYRIFRMRGDDAMAMWGVAFFATGPLAALFQVGYAESLFLLWLFLALYLVMKRRYGWLYLLIPLMGYTRPGILAFALFLGVFGICRWFSRRREPLPAREIVHIVALGALSIVVGFSWQVIAAVVTGTPDAYLLTELAWRRNWLQNPTASFVPLDGFLQATALWFELWGLGAVVGYAALVVTVLAVAALLLFDPRVKRMGPEVRLWSASYLIYLLLVFFPQSSTVRLLVPLSPLWGAAAMPRSRVWRGAVLAACIIGQWWWIYNMYALGNSFWQIP